MSTHPTPNDTAVRVAVPERILRMGSIDLPDPAPDLEPIKALQLYAQQYPHLKRATLSEPHLEGDRLIFEVEKPPVKTKGAT
jgi:PRTRC genetic system protein C